MITEAVGWKLLLSASGDKIQQSAMLLVLLARYFRLHAKSVCRAQPRLSFFLSLPWYDAIFWKQAVSTASVR